MERPSGALFSVYCNSSLLLCSQDQYTLCFEILLSYLDSFDSYANFKAI